MRWFMLRNISIMALVLSVGAALSSATASGDNIFVTNFNSGSVGDYGTIGEYTTSGGTVNPSLVSELSDPCGIAIAPTPEPSTRALLTAGALGLLGWMWRRQATRKSAKPTPFDQQDARPPVLSLPSQLSTANAARRAARFSTVVEWCRYYRLSQVGILTR
jgi:hypothetical protein